MQTSNPTPAKDPRTPPKLPLLIASAVVALLMFNFWRVQSSQVELPYSEFQELLARGAVSELSVGADRITGRLLEPRAGRERFTTLRVEPELAAALEIAGVEYTGSDTRSALDVMLGLLPLLLLVGIAFFFLRAMSRASAGPMALAKNRARVYVEDDTRASFRDVAGTDEAKAELEEVVSFLRNPSRYGRLGARMPKGVLLVGPPGTGKTLLARAVAGEAEVPFFHISGSEFVEMFVGLGAARVRELFQQAREKAPCIIFIDELDALGRARGATPGLGGSDEKEQTLNQLLVEMDGFDGSSGIVLLAATNRPEVLDPALLRAGRFDRQVLVDRPDKAGRVAILGVHLARVELAPDVDAERIAGLTPGFSGADLANLVNEAALMATRRDASCIEMCDFNGAVERLVAGLEKKNRLLSPREREIVAHHEMGHALVATATPTADPVHKISIIPRGVGALGYTMQRPAEDRFLLTREELEDRLAVLLGGRAAELIVYGHLSTGAADDVARATEMANDMVTRYALLPELGSVALETGPSTTPFGLPSPERRGCSEATRRDVDRAVRGLVDAALARARDILERNRTLLDEGATRLLDRESLDEADLAELFAGVERVEPATAA